MTRDMLRKRLTNSALPQDLVTFDVAQPNEAWGVVCEGARYDVFYGERGIQTGLRSFTSEDAALDYVWDQIAP